MIWIAVFDDKHRQHFQSSRILRSLLNTRFHNELYLSSYVLSEVLAYITYLQKRRERNEDEREHFFELCSNTILDSRYVNILYATETQIGSAIQFIRKYPTIPASLSDWLSLVLMVENNIQAIQSFDKDFVSMIKIDGQFSGIKTNIVA
jgi:predicted nucleic acid-binding protein